MEAIRLLLQKPLRPLLLFLVSPVLCQDVRDYAAADECDCYQTNGSDPAYFARHQFFDFRSLSQYAGVPDLIRDQQDSSDALATSDYFLSDGWNDGWVLQSWNNSDQLERQRQEGDDAAASDASYLLINSPNNVYIETEDDDDDNEGSGSGSATFLTMRTARIGGFQTAAEFESVVTGLHYLSVRMLARTRGARGAVTAMFTYRAADMLADVQESDLEVRTSDPADRVQYTNQPSFTVAGDEIPEATRNATLPAEGGDGAQGQLQWTDWAVYRMDWTPERTTHYVNGAEAAAIAFQNPRDPTRVHFNCWSDGGSWSGVMRQGDEAFLQIRWIEMVFNETDTDNALWRTRRDGEASCKRVCSIDETDKIGTAVLLDSGTSTMARNHYATWIPLLAMFMLALDLLY